MDLPPEKLIFTFFPYHSKSKYEFSGISNNYKHENNYLLAPKEIKIFF